MLEFLSGVTINGIELWVVLLCCCGVFLAAFIDAIGGGGGIISVPTYLMAFSGHPTYYVLGTNKVSSWPSQALPAVFGSSTTPRTSS